MEEDNLTGSDQTTIQWSRHLVVGNESKGKGLVEVEVVVAEVDVEAVAEPRPNLLQCHP
jgi:hypothetical protein